MIGWTAEQMMNAEMEEWKIEKGMYVQDLLRILGASRQRMLGHLASVAQGLAHKSTTFGTAKQLLGNWKRLGARQLNVMPFELQMAPNNLCSAANEG